MTEVVVRMMLPALRKTLHFYSEEVPHCRLLSYQSLSKVEKLAISCDPALFPKLADRSLSPRLALSDCPFYKLLPC